MMLQEPIQGVDSRCQQAVPLTSYMVGLSSKARNQLHWRPRQACSCCFCCCCCCYSARILLALHL
jgi:hypothetical protein